MPDEVLVRRRSFLLQSLAIVRLACLVYIVRWSLASHAISDVVAAFGLLIIDSLWVPFIFFRGPKSNIAGLRFGAL